MTEKVNAVDPASDAAREIKSEFFDAVNMTPKALGDWLETDHSRAVGQKDGGSESVGHASGRRIVAILEKARSELTGEDLGHMQKVNGYIARHLKQRPDRPAAELVEMDWTASLKNWGHDPLK